MSATITETAAVNTHVIDDEQVRELQEILREATRAHAHDDWDLSSTLWESINDIYKTLGISPNDPELEAALGEAEEHSQALLAAVAGNDYATADMLAAKLEEALTRVYERGGRDPEVAHEAQRAHAEDIALATVRITPELRSADRYARALVNLRTDEPTFEAWALGIDDAPSRAAAAEVHDLLPTYQEHGMTDRFEKALGRLDRTLRAAMRKQYNDRNIPVCVLLPNRNNA